MTNRDESHIHGNRTAENHRRPEENKLRDPLAQRTFAFICSPMSKSREIKKKSGQRGREIDGVNPRASFTRMDPGKAAVCASAIPKHDTARRKALIFPSISPSIFSWLRGRDRQMERRTAEDVICYSGENYLALDAKRSGCRHL